jgi:hypothetical protein
MRILVFHTGLEIEDDSSADKLLIDYDSDFVPSVGDELHFKILNIPPVKVVSRSLLNAQTLDQFIELTVVRSI